MNMNINENSNQSVKTLANSSEPRFVTDYFPLVCTLIYHDFPIVSVNRNSPKHSYFEFIETKKLKTISERFWAGTLRVEPKKFYNTTKEIKSRLYEPSKEGQI